MAKQDEYSKIIADRMAWIRIELCKMTQPEFAKLIKVSQSHTISEYENGTIRPGFKRCSYLIELCAKHGKKIDYNWLRPDGIKGE